MVVTGYIHLSKQTVHFNSVHFTVCNYKPIKKKINRIFRDKEVEGEILTSGENVKKRKVLFFNKKKVIAICKDNMYYTSLYLGLNNPSHLSFNLINLVTNDILSKDSERPKTSAG